MPTLAPVSVKSLTQLLQGAARESVLIPNGDTPAREVELVTAVWQAEPEHRKEVFSNIVKAWPDGFSIFADMMTVRAEPASKEKPEKEYKAADYIALLNGLGYSFKLCDLDDRVEVNGQPLTDVMEAEIRSHARDRGIRNVNVMRDAYITKAAVNRYHPVKDYLSSLRWDGTDWLATIGGLFADEHFLFPTVFKRWMIGAVGKAYTGSQNRMLVLDGRQGLGKSHFVRWLAKPFLKHYTEGPINPDDKDDLIRLMTNIIWEVSELGSTMRRSDIEALKHFLTRQQVTVRMPYGHNDVIKPALASFIGTVNNIGGILNDASGNRRFMTVNLTGISWDYATLIDINQLWAQAVWLYRAGEPSEPTPAELGQIANVNADYEVEDPLEDLIAKHFQINPARADWFVPTLRIIEVLHAAGWRGTTPRAEAMMISSAATKLKLKRVYTTMNGVTARGWLGMAEKQPSNPPTFY